MLFSGLFGLSDFIDEKGRKHPDSDLEGYLRGYISDNWDLRVDPATGWDESELREKIVSQIVSRYQDVPYDLQIGDLSVDRVIVELSPMAVKRGTGVIAQQNGQQDVPIKSSAFSADDIRNLVETVFAGGTEAYKQYMYAEYMKKKQQNKPIPVPPSQVTPDMPRDYTWAWVVGGLAVAGLVVFAATKGRRRSPAAFGGGQVIDVQALPS